MVTRTVAVIIILLISSVSCVRDKREGTHQANGNSVAYSDDITGWKAEYPKSWPLMSPAEIAKLQGRGEELMEPVAGTDLVGNVRNLLWLTRDKFNSFTSNSEPFQTAINGPFESNQEDVIRVLEESYSSIGMKFDSNSGTTKIDGLDFYTWECKIFGQDGETVLMEQVIYTRLIGDRQMLTLNINYNSEQNRDTLMTIINSSRFFIRD